MYDKILRRYLRGYITDAQLSRYAELNVISKEDFEKIKNENTDIFRSVDE